MSTFNTSVEIHCNITDLQGSLDFTRQDVDPHNGGSYYRSSPFCVCEVSSEQRIVKEANKIIIKLFETNWLCYKCLVKPWYSQL